VLRWIAAGMGEAAKQFRRVNRYLHLPALRAALDATIATRQTEQGGCRLITHQAATEVPGRSGHPPGRYHPRVS
jgi:hypothetical protein